MNINILLTILLLLVLQTGSIGSFFAREKSKDDSLSKPLLPNPWKYPNECGRKGEKITRSSICDKDLRLSDSDKNLIEGILNHGYKYAQGGIAVVSSMNTSFVSQNGGKADKAAKNFAKILHKSWGVGVGSEVTKKQSDNGFILFVSISDRQIYITVGKDLEQKLSTKVLLSIIENMKAPMRRGEYGKAIAHACVEIFLVLSGDGNSKDARARWERLEKPEVVTNPKTEGGDGGGGGGGGGGGILKSTPTKSAGGSKYNKRKPKSTIIPLPRSLTYAVVGVGIPTLLYASYRSHKVDMEGRLELNRLVYDAERMRLSLPPSYCPLCSEEFSKLQSPLQDKDAFLGNGITVADGNLGLGKNFAVDGAGKHVKNGLSEADPRRAVSLGCGHLICLGCIGELLTKSARDRGAVGTNPIGSRDSSCLICDTLEAAPEARRLFQISQSTSEAEQAEKLNKEDFFINFNRQRRRDEILFRCKRIKRAYPNALNDDVFDVMLEYLTDEASQRPMTARLSLRQRRKQQPSMLGTDSDKSNGGIENDNPDAQSYPLQLSSSDSYSSTGVSLSSRILEAQRRRYDASRIITENAKSFSMSGSFGSASWSDDRRGKESSSGAGGEW